MNYDKSKLTPNSALSNLINVLESELKNLLDAITLVKLWAQGLFAKKDGNYELMSVGEAQTLTGQEESTDASMYRTSGGSEDIATGIARINSIKGNTVAWNQLVKNGNFVDTNDWSASSGTISASNNILTYTVSTPYNGPVLTQRNFQKATGHKFLFSCELNYSSDPESLDVYIGVAGYWGVLYRNPITPNQWFKLEGIVEDDGNAPNKNLYMYLRTTKMNIGDTISVKNVRSFDLTLIYGAGNEPTTTEQFEADYEKWFGKLLTYEEYDAGSLRSVQLSALKTTGFNQWDEEIYRGTFSTQDGETKTPLMSFISSNNKIEVLPNMEYYITTPATTRIFLYDKGGIYMASTIVNKKLTIPNNVKYIRFQLGYNGEYKHDICINISWSGTKDGEYEPYEEHVASIPVTTLKGKLNGEGESFTIFPDGMNKFDSIYSSSGKTYASVGGETRAYQEGDATSDTMVTDGHAYTHVKLATPLVYEVDDFTLPIRYQVNDWGTEEQVQVEGVQGVAAILTCLYGVNAVDILKNLPKNYISEQSMDNLLAQLNVATNGTWTKTWNDTTKEWDFSYTPNA